MPLYEYSCGDCRQDFEVLILGRDEPECPGCGGTDLKKLMSVPAAHSANPNKLPMCEPRSTEGCGLPQCGGGHCAME